MSNHARMPFALSLLVVAACLLGGAACAEEPDHDHDAATPGGAAHAAHGDAEHDHDHDHSEDGRAGAPPAATSPVRADHAGHDHGPASPSGDDAYVHDEREGHGHGHADEVRLTPEAIREWAVRTEPAKKHVLIATFAAPARVAFDADAMAHVGSLVPGRVVDVKVRVGDAVTKGDALLVVESTELGEAQSNYLRERTTSAVALAAVDPAKQAYERAKKLYDDSRGIALAEVQKREAELKAAEGAARVAKAGADAGLNRLLLLGMTKDEVRRLEDSGTPDPRLAVRAPIAGRVVEREVTLGELVTPEKERLMVLADVGNVWVVADVPEARLPQVAVGSPARIQIAALPERRFAGRVSHVAAALNPDTRTGSVRVAVPNPDGALRPGMFGSVTFTTGTAATGDGGGEPVLSLAHEAVHTVEGTTAVFVPVAGEANTFAKRAVAVGRPVGGMVPILSGIDEGEPVVVGGAFILKAELGKGEAGHGH